MMSACMYAEKKPQNVKYGKASQYWLTIYMAVLMHVSKILASTIFQYPVLAPVIFPAFLPS